MEISLFSSLLYHHHHRHTHRCTHTCSLCHLSLVSMFFFVNSFSFSSKSTHQSSPSPPPPFTTLSFNPLPLGFSYFFLLVLFSPISFSCLFSFLRITHTPLNSPPVCGPARDFQSESGQMSPRCVSTTTCCWIAPSFHPSLRKVIISILHLGASRAGPSCSGGTPLFCH